MQWCCQLLQSVAKSRAEFYFVQRFAQQKRLRDNPCYTVQFSSNLSRNGIARQVAEKIAQCNRALNYRTIFGSVQPGLDYRDIIFGTRLQKSQDFCSVYYVDRSRLKKIYLVSVCRKV